MFENIDTNKPVSTEANQNEPLVCALWMPKGFKIGPVDPKIGSADHPIDPNAKVDEHPGMQCALWMPKDFKIGPVDPKEGSKAVDQANSQTLATGDVLTINPATEEGLRGRELKMPSGEKLDVSQLFGEPGATWELFDPKGQPITFEGDPDAAGKDFAKLKDGAVLHIGQDKWSIEYPNSDHIDIERDSKRTGLNVDVHRGTKESQFKVAALGL